MGLMEGTETLAARAVQLLKDIGAGRVALKPAHNADILLRFYTTSNGWTIVVFDDAGEWDYIDRFVSPEGEVLKFDDYYDKVPEITNYEPTEAQLHAIWQWDS